MLSMGKEEILALFERGFDEAARITRMDKYAERPDHDKRCMTAGLLVVVEELADRMLAAVKSSGRDRER